MLLTVGRLPMPCSRAARPSNQPAAGRRRLHRAYFHVTVTLSRSLHQGFVTLLFFVGKFWAFSVVAGDGRSEEMAEEIKAAIIACGDEVRGLKAAKADATAKVPWPLRLGQSGPHTWDTPLCQLAELMELKAKYKQVTGEDYAAPVQAWVAGRRPTRGASHVPCAGEEAEGTACSEAAEGAANGS